VLFRSPQNPKTPRGRCMNSNEREYLKILE